MATGEDGSCLQIFQDKELLQITGGMNGLSQPATAQAMMEAYKSLDYKYIGEQFKPVAHQAVAGAAVGLYAGKSLPAAVDGAIGGGIYGATTALLDTDFNKWVKPGPPKPSWADFRRLDNRK
jgi:hypothetical protein